MRTTLQVVSWAEDSLLGGQWGCGAAFLWDEIKPAGVKWSLVLCVKGTRDRGALISEDGTAGTRQFLPGLWGCYQGAGWELVSREVLDLFPKNPSKTHPRGHFSSSVPPNEF